MIDRIKNGKIYTLSLSVQDQNHTIFHEKDENKYKNRKTIKLAYGPLTPNRVGMIHHTDAYSTAPTTTEAENFNFKREIHTVKSLMDNTTDYNELTYVVYKTPFLPIGLICENEITNEETDVANELNIPILFRKKKEKKEVPYKEKPYQKGYQYTREKSLF